MKKGSSNCSKNNIIEPNEDLTWILYRQKVKPFIEDIDVEEV
jgi:hypothetical protein